jgi:hypothetical protein
MKYKDTGFRAFYQHFIAVPLKDNLKAALKDFPDADKANCILTYGYIDRECGLTLEILAAGIEGKKGFNFADGNDTISSKIRIENVPNDDVAFFADEDGSLAKRYSQKIEMLHHYDAPEEVEKTRGMTFLDGSRDPNCVDDVLVYLVKDGLKPEGCWTRIIGLGDHWIMGTLLNEPDQDFGYHIGENIAFFVQETEDKKVICYSDMNPSKKIKAEDLENGSMLEAAVTAFNNEQTEPHLIDILELLRDSFVWIPCNAVMSEEDQKHWDEIAEKLNNDPNADPTELIGKEYTSKGPTRMIPDILQNGDLYFFPVFSTVEAMGEYGENFSKVQKHMLEAISLARKNEKDLAGIVLNAFTEPFVLDAKIWDIVENMKSKITE